METIPEVKDVEIAFGTTRHLPKWEEIPEEFKDKKTTWNKLFSTLFYKGGNGISFKFKGGIDHSTEFPKFIRWWKAHAGSFEPRHEHKEAGIAYMMSKWFDGWEEGENCEV